MKRLRIRQWLLLLVAPFAMVFPQTLLAYGVTGAAERMGDSTVPTPPHTHTHTHSQQAEDTAQRILKKIQAVD